MAHNWTYVYASPAAERSHLLDDCNSPNSAAPAVCGMAPNYTPAGCTWFGTGSQQEYDRAESLPVCMNCRAVLRRRVRALADEIMETTPTHTRRLPNNRTRRRTPRV